VATALAALGLAPACSSNPGVPAPAAAEIRRDAASPSPEGRAEALLRQMTLEEKIAYVGGDRSFYIRAVPRLGIPEIKMADGPAGCRNWGPSTAYPAAIGLAATFDGELAERVGAALGRDCRARGVHVLLAPGVNIQRSPLNGRNFEYLGEDPFLAGKTAAALIRGVQREGVIATVKHFVANNQEWDRNHTSSEVDERTLREIYFPAFERAVTEGHAGAVMTAYNLLNGTYCTHDAWLTKKVLEGEWGFSGFVMSDWSAAHDPLATANGGCDLEMPSGEQMSARALVPLIAQGKVVEGTLDDKVRRILRTVIRAGFLDRRQQRDDVPLDDPSSAEVALAAARRSIVLLKNEGALLPLDRTLLKRIAVIGPNAHPAVWGGSGSAFVTPFHAVSLLDGLKGAAGSAVVAYHPGVRQSSEAVILGRPFVGPVRQEVFAGKDLAGKPVQVTYVDRIDFVPEGAAPAPGLGPEHYAIRWTGVVSAPRAGRYQVVTNADDGIRVKIDGKLVIDDWHDHAPTVDTARLDLAPGEHQVVVEYYQGILGAVAQLGFGPEASPKETLSGGAEVTELARSADVVIVGVGFGQSAETSSVGAAYKPFWPPAWVRKSGLVEAEDSDRPFALPPAQVETVRLAALANPRTIVVVNAGGGVDLQPFVDHVPALLWAWYPGQEGGRALAEVLFGDVSPSGKLPVTLAKRYEDHPSAPYYSVSAGGKTPYGEGVFVGYRGFDANAVAPAFPFGHGLSYTRFDYAGLTAAPTGEGGAAVTVSVTNRGARAGDEVVQVYVAPPKSRVPRPPEELKGFARVSLSPGETRQVSLVLEPRAFAFWDARASGWVVSEGAYEIRVGASSRDIRARQTIEVPARTLPR
jgi:beta-glucosidase